MENAYDTWVLQYNTETKLKNQQSIKFANGKLQIFQNQKGVNLKNQRTKLW
jgi:hypothetical protein